MDLPTKIATCFYDRIPIKVLEAEVQINSEGVYLLVHNTEVAKWIKGDSFIHVLEDEGGPEVVERYVSQLLQRTLFALLVQDRKWYLYDKKDKTATRMDLNKWMRIPITYDIFV